MTLCRSKRNQKKNLSSTSHQWAMSSHGLAQALQWMLRKMNTLIINALLPAFSQLLLMSVSYATEYLSGQLKSAVLAMYPPNPLPIPSLLAFLAGDWVWKDSLDAVGTAQQKPGTTPFQTQIEYNTVMAPVGKLTSKCISV